MFENLEKTGNFMFGCNNKTMENDNARTLSENGSLSHLSLPEH